MKIIVTADLHYENLSSMSKVKAMAEDIKREKPDIIILAGDLGEADKNFEACLQLFKGIGCPVGVVAGNHDLYSFYSTFSSEELWNDVLPRITRDAGFVWLDEENIYIDNVAIVGSMMWYDYSYRSPELEHASITYFDKWHKENWSDGKEINWDRNNKEFANELVDMFIGRMDEADARDDIDTILVASHMPVYREQSYGYEGDGRVSDSFYYNLTAGNLLRQFEKVKYVVSGHTHRGRTRQFGDLCLMTVPSDYGDPKYITLEV